MIKVFGNRNDIFETDETNVEALEIDRKLYEVNDDVNKEKSDKNSDSDLNKATTTTTNIEITPIVKNSTKQPTNSSVIDEVLSEADTESGNPLSKSKLKTMNIEKLKAICNHHNLPNEGSKSVLISRILGETRD